MRMEDNIFDGFPKLSEKVPEGYFDNLKARLARIPAMEEKLHERVVLSPWQKLRPYAAMAACFLGILVAGTGILRMTTDNPSEADVLFTALGKADMIPVTLLDSSLFESDGTETVSDEDIIDYLIASGVSTRKIYYSENIDY